MERKFAIIYFFSIWFVFVCLFGGVRSGEESDGILLKIVGLSALKRFARFVLNASKH